ncbi:armadillo-type protein [Cristinia sonorae]|uniref:Armadillo-type protein n=1 Tax=Cristinia sonorae TaxID=1940300 RepID=A0A8K0UIB9_9AGAR|nr:armadillo-type protein [Cristinia sonorae]
MSSVREAHLCRKVMDHMNFQVQNGSLHRNDDRNGALLFQEHLLQRCQEGIKELERGETSQEQIKGVNSTECSILARNFAQTSQWHQRSVSRFIGELFEVQMLPARFIHDYIERLLRDVEDPADNDIESLCTLLTTAGALLDVLSASSVMETCLTRIDGLAQDPNVDPYLRDMLQRVRNMRIPPARRLRVPTGTTSVIKTPGPSRDEKDKTSMSLSQNEDHSTLLEPFLPLKFSVNRWQPSKKTHVNPDSPEIVERKVKALLNKLTMERFDSISDQIIGWANKSKTEKDGRTLFQVIKVVFEKATDDSEAAWSEMYARLCRKMMEQISTKVQDDGIRSSDGKPITGGHLFRKYLLNRCQEDFERGWAAKDAVQAAAATKSTEYEAAAKAKRQGLGLGLAKFICELFKLQMLTERIMHECVKKLLQNVENPEEEEIESLCKLMTTVGALLDISTFT